MHKRRMKTSLQVSIVAVSSYLVDCTTLPEVKRELNAGGYALVYPPQSGLRPGQIVRIKGNRRTLIDDAAQELGQPESGIAEFKKIAKDISLTGSIAVNAPATTGTDAHIATTTNAKQQAVDGTAAATLNKISAQLSAGTVKHVDLNFGTAKILQYPLRRMQGSNLPKIYQDDVKLCASASGNFYLVNAVVVATGFTYKCTCTDTAALQAQIPKISQTLGMDVKIQSTIGSTVTLQIGGDTPLTIGAMFSHGPEDFR